MDEKQSKKLALDLLKAVSAEEVDAVLNLEDPNSPFSKPHNWSSYGGTNANWGVVNGQSSEPVGALSELIINSIDAVLMRKAREQGIDEESNDVPTSMIEAVDRFFPEVPDGKIVLLNSSEQTKLAERSVLLGVKRGKNSRIYPTYTIADFGEGQNADRFSKTLLSLGKSNKEGIPFVQGRFNMGSTGSINFCTRADGGMYKFIMSKRTLTDKDGKWGWTLIRVRSAEKGEKNPVVQYFSPAGKISRFRDESVQAFGRKDIGVIDGGTIIKLYEYDIGPNVRSVDRGLYNALTTNLLECALPIKIYEFDATPTKSGLRGEGISPRTFAGMKSVISRSEGTDADDDKAPNDDNIDFATHWMNCQAGNLGCVQIFATGIKDFTKNQYLHKYPYRCFYTLNGQAQAKEYKAFFQKAKLDDIENHLIVQVDCDDFDSRATAKVFKSDRERMNQNVHSDELREAVAKALRDSRELRAYAERVRQRRMEEMVEDTEKGKEIWGVLFKDPEIRKLWGLIALGKTVVTTDRGGDKGEKFEGKEFPTVLKLLRPDPKDPVLLLPVNGLRYIECSTDAEDEYLARDKNRGKFIWESSENLLFSASLRGGKLRISVQPPSNAVVDETVDVKIGFNDVNKIEPLFVNMQVKFSPSEKKQKKKTGGEKPPKSGALDPPKIQWVREEKWHLYDFDETSGASCAGGGGDGDVVIYVNRDNEHLKEMLKGEKNDGKRELMEHMFKLSVGILTLSMYKKMKIKENESENWTKYLGLASSGISAHVVTLIQKLGGLKP